jgi:hypothetical protein
VIILVDPLPTSSGALDEDEWKAAKARGQWDMTAPHLFSFMTGENPDIELILGTDSTNKTFDQWIRTYTKPLTQKLATTTKEQHHNHSVTTLQILFRIILRDSNELLSTFIAEMRGVYRDIPRGSLVAERLPYLQSLLVNYREQLQQMDLCFSCCIASLGAVASGHPPKVPVFTPSRATIRPPISPGDYDANPALSALSEDITSAFGQLDLAKSELHETTNWLMSVMSIVESEKAISEAESVTKLTELVSKIPSE